MADNTPSIPLDGNNKINEQKYIETFSGRRTVEIVLRVLPETRDYINEIASGSSLSTNEYIRQKLGIDMHIEGNIRTEQIREI